MVVCPQCNIEHDAGEEFCRKCGKFLLVVEESIPEEGQKKINLLCHKCQLVYKKGTYCRKCGSLLVHQTSSQEMSIQPLEKKSIRRRSKEWLGLSNEKKELEICISKLEEQHKSVSRDVIHSLFIRYQKRLESLSPLHQEIEMELESIRKKVSEEIDCLEKELKPIQKRLEEFQSLYKLGALTKTDFLSEKKEIQKEIKSREKDLKKHRQILALLPGKVGGSIVSSGLTENLPRPFTLLMSVAIIILMGAGVYLFWPRHSQSSRTISKEIVTSPSTLPSQHNLQPALEDQEVKKIKAIFENIKQANIQQDIDLFMSCFSRDFSDRERKRLDALKMWENFNYLGLSYNLKKQTISEDIANIRLEWLIRTSPKDSGQTQDTKTLLDVTLKIEDNRWKIKEIKLVN